MSRRRKKLRKSKPVYAIVVEGKTEFWYLQMLKRNERNLNINIEPKLPVKKKLEDQFKMAKVLAEDYTKVFWIIDLDVVLSETKKSKKGAETSLQKLIKYEIEVQKNEELKKKMVFIINNPCLEFWFLLHFEQTNKLFQKCEPVEKLLNTKKYLSGYEKTRQFYVKRNNDIYSKLKPHVNTALKHATAIKKFSFENPNSGTSQMPLFFKTIFTS